MWSVSSANSMSSCVTCGIAFLPGSSATVASAARTASPAPASSAVPKPPLSAFAAESPVPNRWVVRAEATAARTARPSAPPICCEVLSSPEASPDRDELPTGLDRVGPVRRVLAQQVVEQRCERSSP